MAFDQYSGNLIKKVVVPGGIPGGQASGGTLQGLLNNGAVGNYDPASQTFTYTGMGPSSQAVVYDPATHSSRVATGADAGNANSSYSNPAVGSPFAPGGAYSSGATSASASAGIPDADLAAVQKAGEQDIADQYARSTGSLNQSLFDRGLARSTVKDALQRGIDLDRNKATNDLAAKMAQLRYQYRMSLNGALAQSGQNAVNNAWRLYDWQQQQAHRGGMPAGGGYGGGGYGGGGPAPTNAGTRTLLSAPMQGGGMSFMPPTSGSGTTSAATPMGGGGGGGRGVDVGMGFGGYGGGGYTPPQGRQQTVSPTGPGFNPAAVAGMFGNTLSAADQNLFGGAFTGLGNQVAQNIADQYMKGYGVNGDQTWNQFVGLPEYGSEGSPAGLLSPAGLTAPSPAQMFSLPGNDVALGGGGE